MGLFTKKEKSIKEKTTFPVVVFQLKGQAETCDLRDIPLREQVIISHSIRFFNDPNPCYIHRGAVQVRLIAELEEELLLLPKGVLLQAKDLSQKFLDWVEREYDGIVIQP